VSARHALRRVSLAGLVVVTCLAVACSSSGQGTQAGGANSATTNPHCTGKPLQFTSIVSLTGPVSIPSLSTEIKNANTAALDAVNAECTLGRPIAVALCDDKSDPNQAQQCGLEARSNGSLALLGSSGMFDTGTTAARLPGVLTAGSTVFDLTDPQSFSSTSGLTLVVGGGGVVAGLGKHENVFVVVDTAASRAFVGIAQKVAEAEGVKVDVLYVPANTTDYAPIAAQVSEKKPGSVSVVLPNAVPFVNALASEGITPENVPMLSAVTLMPPNVLDQLGSKANGMYLLTQQAPPSDKDNSGVQQMLKDLKDAGFKADGDALSPASTGAWSNVQALVDILAKLPKSEIATLTSSQLVEAMKAAGPINRPEVAPFDFSKTAFPEISSLAGFRVFSRDAMIIRVENGKYQRVSSFSDATKPFKLTP
jgi:ABC-type branched-subunit amino acid transport system substrate-binding protein